MLIASKCAVAGEGEQAFGHLQTTAALQGRYGDRIGQRAARGAAGVKVHGRARRQHHGRHVGSVRNSPCLALASSHPVDRVEPIAACASHPGGRRQLGHRAGGRRREGIEHVVGGRGAGQAHAVDGHGFTRAHVLAVQHSIDLHPHVVGDGVDIAHSHSGRSAAVIHPAGTGNGQVQVTRRDGQGAIDAREAVLGRCQTARVGGDDVASHTREVVGRADAQAQRASDGVAQAVPGQEARDLLREHRVGSAVDAGAVDRCDHQNRLRDRQRAVGVRQGVVAQARAQRSRWDDGVGAWRLGSWNGGIAVHLQGHARHRVSAQQPSGCERTGSQLQDRAKVHALVAGREGQRDRVDSSVAGTHAGGSTADDIVAGLRASQTQVAQCVVHIGQHIAAAIATHVGRAKSTHATDRQVTAVDDPTGDVRGNDAGVGRCTALTVNRHAQRHIVHGRCAVVVLVHTACSRHSHGTLRDSSCGRGLVSDVVVTGIRTCECSGDIDCLPQARIGIRKGRTGGVEADLISRATIRQQAHRRTDGGPCQGCGIAAVVDLVAGGKA